MGLMCLLAAHLLQCRSSLYLYKQSTYTQQNCLKFNLALKALKRVDMLSNNQPPNLFLISVLNWLYWCLSLLVISLTLFLLILFQILVYFTFILNFSFLFTGLASFLFKSSMITHHLLGLTLNNTSILQEACFCWSQIQKTWKNLVAGIEETAINKVKLSSITWLIC